MPLTRSQLLEAAQAEDRRLRAVGHRTLNRALVGGAKPRTAVEIATRNFDRAVRSPGRQVGERGIAKASASGKRTGRASDRAATAVRSFVASADAIHAKRAQLGRDLDDAMRAFNRAHGAERKRLRAVIRAIRHRIAQL